MIYPKTAITIFPGRYITIPYKTIININIRYFYLEEVTEDYGDEKLL